MWLHIEIACAKINENEDCDMKKNDWILVACISILTIVFMWGRYVLGQQEASQVIVRVNGEEKGRYSLAEYAEIQIGDTNSFVIEDQRVRMISATCPDQHCVHQKAIEKNKESIICLPNQVVVEIASNQEAKLDAIAK